MATNPIEGVAELFSGVSILGAGISILTFAIALLIGYIITDKNDKKQIIENGMISLFTIALIGVQVSTFVLITGAIINFIKEWF